MLKKIRFKIKLLTSLIFLLTFPALIYLTSIQFEGLYQGF